jgi:membrane-associated phospholipid phosphatase
VKRSQAGPLGWEVAGEAGSAALRGAEHGRAPREELQVLLPTGPAAPGREWTPIPPLLARGAIIAAGALSLSGYFLTAHVLASRAGLSLATPLDAAIPLVMEFEWVYLFYLLMPFVPVLQVRRLGLLWRALLGYLAVQITGTVVFLVFPVTMARPHTAIDPTASFLAWTIGLNYVLDPPVNCFPSLHVANAFFIACVVWRLDVAVGRIALGTALSIAISTLFVKHHYIADVLGGVVLGWGGYRLLFAPFVPADAERRDLTYPRGRLIVIPALFAIATATLYALYRAGMGYQWPPGF